MAISTRVVLNVLSCLVFDSNDQCTLLWFEWTGDSQLVFVAQLLLVYMQQKQVRVVISKLFQWLFGWITVTVLKVSDKVNPRFSTAAIRIAPIHTSWFWQVHTDLILSLERLRTPLPPTAAHTHRLFICRSPAGLHGGNGWSGNRWRPVKYQRSELWVHLSINFSTGCPRAQSARVAPRRVTVKTQNKQWNAVTDHVQR